MLSFVFHFPSFSHLIWHANLLKHGFWVSRIIVLFYSISFISFSPAYSNAYEAWKMIQLLNHVALSFGWRSYKNPLFFLFYIISFSISSYLLKLLLIFKSIFFFNPVRHQMHLKTEKPPKGNFTSRQSLLWKIFLPLLECLLCMSVPNSYVHLSLLAQSVRPSNGVTHLLRFLL